MNMINTGRKGRRAVTGTMRKGERERRGRRERERKGRRAVTGTMRKGQGYPHGATEMETGGDCVRKGRGWQTGT